MQQKQCRRASEEVAWERESGMGTSQKTRELELNNDKTFKLDDECMNADTQELRTMKTTTLLMCTPYLK